MTKNKPTPSRGRYDLAGARAPGSGFGRPPPNVHVRTRIVAVEDPGELVRSESGAHTHRQAGEGRLHVTVNHRVDVLEHERAHRRISEAAYRVGRIAQAVFERARGPGASSWTTDVRIDAYTAKELAIIHGLDNAERIANLVHWLRTGAGLGRVDANILQRVLGESKSFSEVATLQGKSGDRGARYVAERFRDALEALAHAKAARGAQRRAP